MSAVKLIAFNQILLVGLVAFVALRPAPAVTIDTGIIERRVVASLLRATEDIILDGLDYLSGPLGGGRR